MHGGFDVAKRKKLKSPQIVGMASAEIYDLRSEYVGGQPAHSGSIDVPNPHNPQQKITVFRSIRDPLEYMHDRRDIDDCQYTTGRLWQRYLEDSEVGGARAIDTTKEFVDGGQFKEPDITRMSIAIARLKKAKAVLQEYDVSLIYDVLERNMSISAICAARSITSGRQICYVMERFRGALDDVAKIWDLAHLTAEREYGSKAMLRPVRKRAGFAFSRRPLPPLGAPTIPDSN